MTLARGAQTIEFAEALFASAIEDLGHAVPVFALPSGRVRFARSTEAVLSAAEEFEAEDVYIGQPIADPPEQGRGGIDDVSSIVALWADVDIAGDGHARAGLPPTLADAESVVRRIGPRPSAVVHSGGGLQAWWLLSEPLEIATTDDRKRAVSLAKQWSMTCRECARALGFEIDPVSDISRVMRLPGTFNRKTETPRPVELTTIEPERRYHLDDLEEVMVAPELVERSVRSRERVGHLTLDPEASPNGVKMGVLLSDPKAMDTWERQRVDDKTSGWTASEWDMSLAGLASNAGWTDQEICDLLIASRRKHGDRSKLRQDYYQRTIGFAKSEREHKAAIDELRLGSLDSTEPQSEQEREARLRVLTKAIGVEITRVIRQGVENPIFTLVMHGGTEIPVGPASVLLSQSSFSTAVFKLTGVTLPPQKPRDWQKLCEVIYRVSELVDTYDGTRVGRLREWLRGYIPRNVYGDGDDASIAHAIEMGAPFTKGVEIWLHSDSLRKWLHTDVGERIDRDAVADMLRASGFVPEVARSSGGDGDRVQRRYWRGAVSFLELDEEEETVNVGEL